MADPTAKRMVGDTVEQVKAQAGAAGDAARQTAARLGDQMREAAESFMHEQQERVAEAVHDFAEVLRHTADTLEREDRTGAARYADKAAAQIDRLSESMRRQQLREMLSNTEDFARRQPVLFIAGAVAIGFVFGRVLSRPAGRSEGTPRLQEYEGYATTGGESRQHPGAFAGPSEGLAGYGASLEAESS